MEDREEAFSRSQRQHWHPILLPIPKQKIFWLFEFVIVIIIDNKLEQKTSASLMNSVTQFKSLVTSRA